MAIFSDGLILEDELIEHQVLSVSRQILTNVDANRRVTRKRFCKHHLKDHYSHRSLKDTTL